MRLDLVLKEIQTTINNMWEFTHAGETKLITGQRVNYYVADKAEALASFDWDEIKEARLDGMEIFKDEPYHDYLDLILNVSIETNIAFHQGLCLRRGMKLYGHDTINYQSVIDILITAHKDLKQCVTMLEILKQKRE